MDFLSSWDTFFLRAPLESLGRLVFASARRCDKRAKKGGTRGKEKEVVERGESREPGESRWPSGLVASFRVACAFGWPVRGGGKSGLRKVASREDPRGLNSLARTRRFRLRALPLQKKADSERARRDKKRHS